jgi:hypothetical protein
MSRRSLYKVHKWLAITVGGFVLLWLISGIVMILPPPFPGTARQRPRAPLNLQGMTVSPAEAIEALAKVLGEQPHVRSIGLRRIADTVAYEVTVQERDLHLIDAQSGQLITITPRISEQIARDYIASQARVLESELITHHSIAYQGGPLPAYRLVFDEDQSTIFYVSTRDGTVRSSDRWSRIQGAMESIHTFQPLKLIGKRDTVRKGLIVLLSVVGIGVVGTGYYLALPCR